MKVFLSWVKKNAITIALVVVMALLLVLVVLGFWFKIRGFKIADLLYKLQILQAENEIGHLNTKREVLQGKEDVATETVETIETQINEEEKKIEVARRKVKGMTNAEIAAELTDLGF